MSIHLSWEVLTKTNGWESNSFVNKKIENLKNRKIRASVNEQVFGYDPDTENIGGDNGNDEEKVLYQDL